ncbi:unnamed protein product, partial [Polarella glacialis]
EGVDNFLKSVDGRLVGFIHSAGILQDAMLMNLTWEKREAQLDVQACLKQLEGIWPITFEAVFAPKHYAALYLHDALERSNLRVEKKRWTFRSRNFVVVVVVVVDVVVLVVVGVVVVVVVIVVVVVVVVVSVVVVVVFVVVFVVVVAVVVVAVVVVVVGVVVVAVVVVYTEHSSNALCNCYVARLVTCRVVCCFALC